MSCNRKGDAKRKESDLESIFEDLPYSSPYVQLVDKLESVGPLNITNLNDFLVNAKADFLNLYKDKSISDLKISDFKIIKKLGSGTFGKVILAELKKDETVYAIKVINKKTVIKEKHFRYVHNEKRILQSINFPFVIYLKYFLVDFNFLYFVMPYVQGGDFQEYLEYQKPLSEPHARFYMSQLVLALEYLHYLELIHRDVKPENIIIDSFGYIKLADFGQCIRCTGNDRAWTLTGTPDYMAPEIIKGHGYDCAVDWWSLGVTLYEMCAGQRPFKHQNTNTLYKIILQSKYEIPDFLSKKLANLFKGLLTSIPSKRIGSSVKGAKNIKSHSWFNTTDWYRILNRTLEAPYVPLVS